MVITIVPPVGPPVPVLVGKAIQPRQNSTYDVYLNEGIDEEGVFFETEDETKLFPNGTISYRYETYIANLDHSKSIIHIYSSYKLCISSSIPISN